MEEIKITAASEEMAAKVRAGFAHKWINLVRISGKLEEMVVSLAAMNGQEVPAGY